MRVVVNRSRADVNRDYRITRGRMGLIMRLRRHRILALACITSTAVCALIALQLAKVVPPIGFSWGDDHGLHGGRACALGLDGEIMFETLSGVKRMPGGSIIGADVKE